jgi:xylulokinase
MIHLSADAGEPSAPLVLAVDLGTSGCKCALITYCGVVAAWAFEPVPLYIEAGAAEHDPDDWWSAFLKAASALCKHEALRRRITVVCCSTASEGTVCVDRDGNAIGRAMLYLDMRGRDAIARRLRGRLFKIEGMDPWKLWRWIRLTGGAPAASGKDTAGHMAYIRDHEPARYERTYKFLNILDYMNLRLTGRFCATPDSQVPAWVTDNRDLSRVSYSDELIRRLGIEKDKLPELVEPGGVLGLLLPHVADALGLKPDTIVVTGATDTASVAAGAAVKDFAPHLYLGTSSWIGAHVPFMKTDVFNKIASVPCAVTGRYLALGIQSTAGANLSFLRDRVLYHPDELLTNEQTPDVYEILNKIALRVPPGAKGLMYLPWLFGERTPVDDPSLRAGLLNMSLAHSREDIIRAVMEGVALNTRWMLEPFAKFIGRDPGAIVAVGGGAQSDVWCQIMADVTGQPIRQAADPIQSNAIGAAFLAGIGMGAFKFSDLPGLQRERCVYEPNPSLKGLYDDKFALFKEFHRKLAPIYRRLNAKEQASSNALG